MHPKLYTFVILEDGKISNQYSSLDLDDFKNNFPEFLKSYFDDALYYGQEKAFIDNKAYRIFVSKWNVGV